MITKAIRFFSSVGDEYESSLSTKGRPTGQGAIADDLARQHPGVRVMVLFRCKKTYSITRIFVSRVYNMLLRFAFRPRFRDVSSGAWHRTVAVLFAGLLVCTAARDSSEAALASAPFAVSLAVSPQASGNSVTVRIELQPTRALEAIEPFDLYVLQLQGFQDALFMTASGSWSRSPASLRQGLSARRFAPVTVQWTEGRLGSIHLLVIAVRVSSDPFVQANWLFRPVLRGAAVRRRLADAPDRGRATLALVGLGVVSVMAIGVVLYLPRRRRVTIS